MNVRKPSSAADELAGNRPIRPILETALDAVVAMGPDGRVAGWNRRAEEVFGWSGDEAMGRPMADLIIPERLRAAHRRGLAEFLETGRGVMLHNRIETVALRRDGSEFPVELAITPLGAGDELVFVGFVRDITLRKQTEEDLREQASTLETINRINQSLAAELNLERLVQAVTDAATEASGAEFGAFFYNVLDEAGERYMLYTLSGAPREAFAKFPMPRNTPLFCSTFQGERTERLDDVTKDPRYGQNPPHRGIPAGHLPVRSYLAVPVKGRSGHVIGGLFFGHSKPGMFTERHERIANAIAVQAAIGIDNAEAYRRAEREIARREQVEKHQELLLGELNHRVKNVLSVVLAIARQTAPRSRSLEEFSRSFFGRLSALARTHGILTARGWQAGPLPEVVEHALAPHGPIDDSRVAIAGPDVLLDATTALTVGMILHELVTNASKYGALSVPGGRIRIEWRHDESDGAPAVRLNWRESGLEGLRRPSRRGFGTTMIETSVRQLEGHADLSWRSDGVDWELLIPLGAQSLPQSEAPEAEPA